jgi:hypothetical protein
LDRFNRSYRVAWLSVLGKMEIVNIPPSKVAAIGEAMSSRIVSWVFILLVCLALIAALFIVIGFLADQTGEASLVHNQLN